MKAFPDCLMYAMALYGIVGAQAQNSIDFYHTVASPPCRTVMLTAKAIGLEMNMIEVNLLKEDNLKPEYLKLNPQHTIPTIVDNGYVIWDSHAIAAYLVTKYAKDDALYPKDPQKRAVVDQRLHFDTGMLFPRMQAVFGERVKQGKKTISDETASRAKEALQFLDTFLQEKQWIAGDQMTIADFSVVSTLSTLEIAGIDVSEYPNLSAWFERCKSSMAGYQEINQKGLDIIASMFN